jgi:prepilin-type N-terminal cleavage/methylation domain-containing protein
VKQTRTARGFTLVEAICALTVLSVMGSVSSGLVFTAIRSCRDAAASSQLHEEASVAMEVMMRELRGVDLTGSGAPDISAVTPASISYGTSAFSASGGNLTWVDAGAAGVTLVSGVSAFEVRCYDGTNTELDGTLSGAGCAAIRRVSVSLTVTRDGVSETVRSRVFLRCFMEGVAP